MKKVLIISVLVMLLALALVACDIKPENPETPICDHIVVIDEAVPATCADTGLTAGAHCSICDKVLVPQETVGVTGIHTTIVDEAVAPTCTSTGLTAGTHCSVCNEIIVAQEILPAEHTVVVDKAVAPTCTEIGLTEGSHCLICGTVIVSQEVINPLGHKDANPIDNSCDVCKTEVDSITFTLSDDSTSYIITDASGLVSGDITLPSTYNNKPVTIIGMRAFAYCNRLTSVTIPDSVVTIEYYAFECCSNLGSVTFGENSSLTTINNYTFDCCYSLTSVFIPASVTTIGYEIFRYCTSLTSIVVDEDNSNYKSIDGNLYSKDGQTLIQYAMGKSNTTFEIPDGVTTIGKYAFGNNENLTSVSIPNSVVTIDYEAFGRCCNIESVILGEDSLLTTIVAGAFAHCENLTSIFIPARVTAIGSEIFYYCTSLTNIVVDEDNSNYKSIDGNLYSKDGQTLIQYAIGKSNTTFEIPDGVTTIGRCAFRNSEHLTSVTIPDSVVTIEYYAFECCSNLGSVTFGENSSLTTINNYAFERCNSLTSVFIPASVTTIGYEIFRNCTSLTSIVVDEDNSNYKSIDGNLYSKDGQTLIQYAIGKSNTTFEIPAGVTTIVAGAFQYCNNLTSIVIPDSVTTIGERAFAYCDSLTDVYFTGTEEEWSQIVIDWDNEYLTNATIHYNYVEE